MTSKETCSWKEFAVAFAAAVTSFLPFLAIQYDTNGVIEALAVESGQLFQKNHMLYRPLAFVIYSSLHWLGYSAGALSILQVMNAVCGALAAAFAYVAYKRMTGNRLASAAGVLFLATSFTYWLFSTDAAYITLAALFASAGLACLLCGESWICTIGAGIAVSFSVLTWEAAVFAVPAMALLLPAGDRMKKLPAFTVTAGVLSTLAYLIAALGLHRWTGPLEFAGWLTSYGEGGSLPMWGKWESARILSAGASAVRSIVPALLAVPLSEITSTVQLGRIAVDLALAAFFFLTCFAAAKARSNALRFFAGYLCFMPFIVWWDPFEPKWFFIPNIFFAGFFACALTPWLHGRRAQAAIVVSVLLIAVTNFVTTIRPRHNQPGPDRLMAACVAAKMQPQDLIITAEWGWPDYLQYLHERRSLSAISEFSSLKDRLEMTRRAGGTAYIPDPGAYSEAHIAWLQSQSSVGREDLNRLAGAPAFSCYGRTIFVVRGN